MDSAKCDIETMPRPSSALRDYEGSRDYEGPSASESSEAAFGERGTYKRRDNVNGVVLLPSPFDHIGSVILVANIKFAHVPVIERHPPRWLIWFHCFSGVHQPGLIVVHMHEGTLNRSDEAQSQIGGKIVAGVDVVLLNVCSK